MKYFIISCLISFSIVFGATYTYYSNSDSHIATCKGADPCKACKNCSNCKHCKSADNNCGVCK